MTYHIPSDPSAPAQSSWAVIYSHEYGIDVTLYPSEEVARRAGSQIVVNCFNRGELTEFDETELERIALAINSRDWNKAMRLFNSGSESENISIEKPAFWSDSEVEIPTMTLESNEDEETEEESNNNDE